MRTCMLLAAMGCGGKDEETPADGGDADTDTDTDTDTDADTDTDTDTDAPTDPNLIEILGVWDEPDRNLTHTISETDWRKASPYSAYVYDFVALHNDLDYVVAEN